MRDLTASSAVHSVCGRVSHRLQSHRPQSGLVSVLSESMARVFRWRWSSGRFCVIDDDLKDVVMDDGWMDGVMSSLFSK